MPLAAGSRLGPYEIVSPIGAGGMGLVFKAVDARLGRSVAIKVLPDRAAASAEHRERFEREAKAISQLNHPHICTLHDIGEHDGIRFLVMEYIEGETLAERLKKGPLKLASAIRYGAQIAEGLDAANRAGILHRDLKPANVMLTKSGVKLLDFGIARLMDDEVSAAADPLREPDAPTRQRELTQERAILGTPQYMAPEQVEGKPLDARADVHALGAVLYEMISGRKAFSGESPAGLASAILTTTPEPLSTHVEASPAALDYVLSKCLEKDPDDRWHSAHDVAVALKGVETEPTEPAPPTRRSLPGILAPALLGAVAAALAVLALRPAPSPSDTDLVRLTLDLPAGRKLETSPGRIAAISPDGRQFVFATTPVSGSGLSLYRRNLSEPNAAALPGTAGFFGPFFSPDGATLGFLIPDRRVIATMPLAGGPAREVTTLSGGVRGAGFSDDGYIWFGSASGLWRVPATGGDPEQMTAVGPGDFAHIVPVPLPEDHGVLFSLDRGSAARVVAHLSLETGEHRPLFDGLAAAYLRSGHLVYLVGEEVLAARFDLRSLSLTGVPEIVAQDVRRPDQGYFSVGADGTVAYLSGVEGGHRLVWVDRTGAETPVLDSDGPLHMLRVSPDGSRFAADRFRDDGIWVVDFARGTQTLIARSGTDPLWTPDGSEIVWSRGTDLYIKSSDGSGDARPLLQRERRQSALSWTPDGRVLVITDINAAGDRDILLVDRDGGKTTFLATPANENAAAISPDGAWIAYQSDESGRFEIYVQPFPGPGGRVIVSTAGGKEPLWARDGEELFYRQGTAVLSVPVEKGPDFFAEKPVLLFDGPYRADNTGHPSYDVAPDGERFLMARVEDPDITAIHVILNLEAKLASSAR